MYKSKKILALFLVITMITVVMVGCSSKTESVSDKSTSSSSSSQKSDEETKASSDEKEVSLIYSNVKHQPSREAAALFKEIVEKETNGSVEVKVFNDDQLGEQRVVFESMRIGDIDMAAAASAPIANMYPDLYLFDAPYMFKDNQHVYDVLDGEIGQTILADMEKIGLKGLGFWENGFRHLTNSKRPVRTPEDLDGLKIRTMENPVQLATWEALGANPTPMAYSELFTALQQKVVDGQENGYGILDDGKIYEVNEYLTTTGHVYGPMILAMNLDRWNSLSENQQKAIENGMREATIFQRNQCKKYDDEIRKKFEDIGIKIIDLTPEEKAEFTKLVKEGGVYEMIKEKMDNPQYVDQILD
jgi:tripartite ATP-independent transporter DctP family solute receptor